MIIQIDNKKGVQTCLRFSTSATQGNSNPAVTELTGRLGVQRNLPLFANQTQAHCL
jgi:hypothetical protein